MANFSINPCPSTCCYSQESYVLTIQKFSVPTFNPKYVAIKRSHTNRGQHAQIAREFLGPLEDQIYNKAGKIGLAGFYNPATQKSPHKRLPRRQSGR